MTAPYPLFFPDYALGLTKAYVEGFASRLLPVLAGIKDEADEREKEYRHRAVRRIDPEAEPDWESIEEAAFEHGLEHYEYLVFLRGQLIGLASAGLFHLWEKLSKDFIDIELRHVAQLPGHNDIAKWHFHQICSKLGKAGIHIKPGIRSELDLLRKLTNTVKHGAGQSCQGLFKGAPELFGVHAKIPPFDHMTADMLHLEPEHFERFARAVLGFWQCVPRTVVLA
jgi:hypothetical protein